MFRRVAPAIVVLTGLVPAMAQAQNNIDQDKTPAQIFANDCGTCHKSPRGLANGRGSSGLASFLTEHYTASKDEAAALAAYVMGAGGGEATPAARGGPKPAAPDHGRATVEEAKPPVRGARTPGKPEETPASGSIPTTASQEQGERKPVLGRREPQPAVPTRGRRQEPPAPAEPAAASTEPATPSPSAQAAPEASPSSAAPAQSAAAPANTDSGETAPVPRDDIPD